MSMAMHSIDRVGVVVASWARRRQQCISIIAPAHRHGNAFQSSRRRIAMAMHPNERRGGWAYPPATIRNAGGAEIVANVL